MGEPAEDLQSERKAAIEYLRTAACMGLTAQITEFENSFFGSDFNWSLESMQRWLKSGSLFYTAACEGECRRIRALASVLIGGAASCQRLLGGEIAEYELVPWFLESDGPPPMFYFSSVLSDSPEHLRQVYRNLLLDVESYLKEKSLKIYDGISIATGAIGYQHLTKNGFLPVEGPKYLGKYRFMGIDAASAKTEFWCRVLSRKQTETETAREVEARLRTAKAARLCGLYGTSVK
jgi:hypothetical protein